MVYSTQQQAIYVGELSFAIVVLLTYGFFLLRSKREKDEKYRMFGWGAYGFAFILLVMLAFTVSYFVEG